MLSNPVHNHWKTVAPTSSSDHPENSSQTNMSVCKNPGSLRSFKINLTKIKLVTVITRSTGTFAGGSHNLSLGHQSRYHCVEPVCLHLLRSTVAHSGTGVSQSCIKIVITTSPEQSSRTKRMSSCMEAKIH